MSTNKFEALGSDDSEGDEGMNNHNNQPLEVEPGAFTPLPIPEGEHKLQSQYCFWYSRRGPGKQNHNFDQNLKLIGRFGTCEQFWSLYSHMVKPGDLASHSDFHLFKMGIKPMWEDEANKFGGKWIVRLRKGVCTLDNSVFISTSYHFVLRIIISLLGELGPSHARGAVHGGGGDMWCRCVHQVSGGHPEHLEQNCV